MTVELDHTTADAPDAFHLLRNVSSVTDNTQVKASLHKWGLDVQHHSFRFSGTCSDMADFTNRLMCSRAACEVFQVRDARGNLQQVSPGTEAKGHRVRCTLTRLDVFDKMAQNCSAKIFHDGGWRIIKLPNHPDVLGFTVHDQLRELILCEDSVNRNVITDSERSEFLWQVFEHVVLGGNVNQFEDDAMAYRSVAKLFYKCLIRVRRESTSHLAVKSTVFKVTSQMFGEIPLFPTESKNNFCYVVADNVSKTCHLIYHAMRP